MLVADPPLDRTLILTETEVVFSPVSAAGLLESPLDFTVTNAPDMVDYEKLVRDAEAIARECRRPEGVNLDLIAGGLLLLRCSTLGAARFGLRPVAAVALWEQSWLALRGDLPLPGFLPDEIWGQLVNAARVGEDGNEGRDAHDQR